MPIEITASKTTFRVGEPEPPVLEVTGSSGNVSWSCNFGACVPDDETVTTLSAENVSRYADAGDAVVVTVTDLDTEEEASVSIDVFATFPFQPGWDFEAEVDEDTEISEAEDNSEVIFEGKLFGVWPLAFNRRDYDEYLVALRFRAAHGKRKHFYLDDRGLEQLLRGRFDSPIKLSPHNANGFSYSFVFICPQWVEPAPEQPDAPVASVVDAVTVNVFIAIESGAASYKVLRSANGGAFVEIASGVPAGAFVDSTASPLTDYVYRVVGTNPGGDSPESPDSNEVTTPQIAAPAVPVLSINTVDSDAHLTTTATARAVSYKIYRATDGGSFSLFDTVSVSMGAALDYHDTTGEDGTVQYYKVKASNDGGDSAYSNEVEAVMPPPDLLTAGLLIENRFDEGSGQQLFNKAGAFTPFTNYFGIGELFFVSPLWTLSSVTATNGGFTDPLGNNSATRIVTTSGQRRISQTMALSAGTYTIGLWVKSNTGLDQTFRMSGDNTGTFSSNFTATPSWQRFSYTFTVGAGTTGRIPLNSNAAGDALDVLIYGATLVPGASDVTYPAQTFDQNLGAQGTSDAADPAWNPDYLDFQGSCYTYGASSVAHSLAQATVYAVAKWDGAQVLAGYSPLAGADYASNKLFLAADDAAQGTLFKFNNNSLKLPLPWLRDSQWHVICGTYDGSTLRFYVDGWEMGSKAAAGLSAVSVQKWTVSNANFVGFFPGPIGYDCLYDVAHSASDVMLNTEALAGKMADRGVTLPGITKLIAVEGDSISDHLLAAGFGYAYKAFKAAAPTFAIGRNFAVSGSTMTNVNARAASVDAMYDPSRAKNVLSILIGRNDLLGAGSSTAFLASLEAYLTARKAVGWTTLVCTMLPSTASNINARRAEVNAWILADPAGVIDAVCDFAANATYGGDAAASDAVKYPDGTHPSDSTQALMGADWSPVAQSLL